MVCYVSVQFLGITYRNSVAGYVEQYILYGGMLSTWYYGLLCVSTVLRNNRKLTVMSL